MKPGLVWAWGLAVWGGLWAWPSTPPGPPSARGGTAAPEPEPAVPRVAVVVLVDPFLGNPATVTYDRRVAQSVVERDLAALAEALRVPLSRLGKWQLTTTLPLEGGARGGTAAAAVQTQVSFHLPTVVDRVHGAFRLAPFVQAFQTHRWLSLDFLVSDPFPFQGLRDYEDDRVRIRFRGGRNTYSYWIYVKEVTAAPFSLPVMAPLSDLHIHTPTHPHTHTSTRPVGAGPWIGVLGLACLSGLAVFLMVLSLGRGSIRPAASRSTGRLATAGPVEKVSERGRTRMNADSGEPEREPGPPATSAGEPFSSASP